MKVYFYTPTLISYIDLISIGGSEKEGDESTIGQFHTGLKNAIALFMRNNIDISFNTYSESGFTQYKPEVYVKEDISTGKTKELIGFRKNDGSFYESTVSPKLGIDWELFMSLREIYANMLDEGGWYRTEPEVLDYGTEIVIEFEEGSEFHSIWENRNQYINETEPIYRLDRVDILENPDNYLKIYKQNMLVYENRDEKSKYAYNIHFGQLDDRRKLRDYTEESNSILRYIAQSNNEEFLNSIISHERGFLTDDFFNKDFSIYYASQEFIDKVEEVYNQYGEVYTFKSILDHIKRREDCKIGGRKIRTLQDSIWISSEVAEVEMSVKQIETAPKELSLIEEIESMYNIKIECSVIKGNIKGSKCIADKHNKTLIVAEDFDINKDFHKFLVQYYDLTVGGNIIDVLSKKIVELIQK